MKELSIEQKAKRYDEAIKVAEKYHNGTLKDVAETIFPELAESKDEKMANFIKQQLDNIKATVADNYKLGEELADAIDWLEEQGKHEAVSLFTFDDVLAIQCAMTNAKVTDKELYNALQSLHDKVHDVYHNEKQCKQEPTDKTGPKFNVEKDKWYVCTSQYSNCIEGRNYKASSNGRIIDDYGTEYDMHGDASRWFRPWNIQDAKDGDVLCCESGWTCIFKALDNHRNNFSSYCFMDKDKWFCNTGCECHTLDERFVKAYNGEISPATKEQREQLENAMADAGYTFDFESKELKKIGQASDSFCREYCKGFQEADKCFADVDCKAKREAEQKATDWSEEDERMFTRIEEAIKSYYAPFSKDAEEMLNWFNPIKDRIQPQNIIVTDEELANARNEAYNEALDKIEYHSDTPTFGDGWSAAIWYLKKKNAQFNKNCIPTDEQMDKLYKYAEQNNYDGSVLTSLYNELKKLMEK
jgi:hypothetical protein